jgi:uncharacterized protein YkwD
MARSLFCSFSIILASFVLSQVIAVPTFLAGRDAVTIADDFLTAHNTVRAQHGAVDLTWNSSLVDTATQWANGCVFQHSGGPDGGILFPTSAIELGLG